MHRWVRLTAAGALAAIGFAMAPLASGQERRCELSAYTIDEDPKGINVRAGPSAQAKVVGVIRYVKDDDVGVSITAESNGWFRIKEYERYANRRQVQLTGWVHGSRLGASLMIMQAGKASEQLREEPSDRSKTLLLLSWDPGGEGKSPRLTAELPWNKREIIDFEKIKHAATAVPLACQGDWVKIRVHRYEGWVPKTRLCGNPVTTCN